MQDGWWCERPSTWYEKHVCRAAAHAFRRVDIVYIETCVSRCTEYDEYGIKMKFQLFGHAIR